MMVGNRYVIKNNTVNKQLLCHTPSLCHRFAKVLAKQSQHFALPIPYSNKKIIYIYNSLARKSKNETKGWYLCVSVSLSHIFSNAKFPLERTKDISLFTKLGSLDSAITLEKQWQSLEKRFPPFLMEK